MEDIAGPLPQDAGVDPKAAAGGSSRQRWFKKSTKKPLHKYPCLGVIWLSYPYPFLVTNKLI